jgi:hypothetical protein
LSLVPVDELVDQVKSRCALCRLFPCSGGPVALLAFDNHANRAICATRQLPVHRATLPAALDSKPRLNAIEGAGRRKRRSCTRDDCHIELHSAPYLPALPVVRGLNCTPTMKRATGCAGHADHVGERVTISWRRHYN